MLKFTNYFYLFSKLTTSFVLLLIIIIMGYLVFFTYLGVDNESNDLDYKLLSLSESVIQNNNKLLNIEKKLTKNDIIINEIKNLVLQNNNNLDGLDYTKDLERLSQVTKKLQEQISKLKLDKYSKETNSSSKLHQINEIDSLSNLICIKYKNGEGVNNEMLLLESLLPQNKKAVYEKLNLLQYKKFYGVTSLAEELNTSIKKYSKNNFTRHYSNNSMLIFLSKFISIKPRNIGIYQDKELNKIMLAKKYMELEDVNLCLSHILLLENSDKFFLEWIEQAKIFLEFKSTIEQVK